MCMSMVLQLLIECAFLSKQVILNSSGLSDTREPATLGSKVDFQSVKETLVTSQSNISEHGTNHIRRKMRMIFSFLVFFILGVIVDTSIIR